MTVAEQFRLIGPVIYALWIGWLVSWLIAAGWSAPTEKRPSIGAQLPDRIVTVIGALMIAVPIHGDRPGGHRVYHLTLTTAWVLVAFVALGIAICWWARIYLGRLWSGSVTQKQDHKIIDAGPYGIVRHPIYFGILISVFATAFVKATLLGFGGALVMTLGFYLKARLEERFLSKDLGPDYAAYRARVPMLVPFIGV